MIAARQGVSSLACAGALPGASARLHPAFSFFGATTQYLCAFSSVFASKTSWILREFFLLFVLRRGRVPA